MKFVFRSLRKHLFTISLLASVLAAMIWPAFFTQWGSFKLAGLIGPLIMVIMFGMGTTLSIADFVRVGKMPIPVMIGVGLQFLLMPALGFAIARILRLEPDLFVGCIVIGSVAGGTASNVMAYIARANVALSVTMTCVSTMLSPFVTPFLVKFYAGAVVEINVLAMAFEIVKVTIVPTVLGLVVHRLLKAQFERNRAGVEKILSIISMTGVCLILAVIMGPAHEKAMEAGLLLLCVAALHNTSGLLAGYWATRFVMRFFPGQITERDCRTIAIEVGMQNGGMGTQLAMKFFTPVAALVPNIFGIWMNVTGSMLANYWGKKGSSAMTNGTGRNRHVRFGLALAGLTAVAMGGICRAGSVAPGSSPVFTSQTVCTPRRLPASEASVHDISVKPGDDLQGVIAAIAEARRSGVAPSGTLVRVMFSGGDYRLSASLNLDGACSDTLWRAAPGARVRLVGGVPVEARRFTPVADPAVLARLPKERTAPVFVADVSALLPGALQRNPDVLRAAPVPPHFYANGRLMQEARWPNEGWTSFARAVETGAPPRGTGELESRRWKWTPGVFIYGNPRAARWDFADGVLLNGYWTHDWDNETRRAAAWETRGTNRVIRFASPGTYGTGVGTWGLKERRFYAVDLLEELDAPGEWYLDRARKLLYAVPRNGQSLSAADEPFLATLAEPLLVCRASRCRFENLVFAYGAGRGADVSADDVVFSNCTFTALGGDGMRLSGNRNLVTHCRFAELGGGGLAVSGGDRARLRRADTVVEDTTVSSWGRYRRCYAGACNLEGCGIVVRRNEFFDAPHMAMRYEGNEILIESNRIHHVVLETNDAGAIYSGRDWTTAGNVLRGNFIHHLGNPASAGDNGVMALYFDDCDCGDDVLGNVFWKVPRGIMIGGGREHPVRGNLFVECALGYSIDNRGMTWKNWNVPGTSWHLEGRAERLRYREEPWRSRYPWLANIMNDDPQEPKNDPVEENVFVDCREVCRLPSGPKGEKAFSNLVMRANLVVRTRGASGGCKVPDARPQVAAGFRVIDGTPEKPYDPGFVDAANGDFRLRPDAPLRTAVR